MGIFRGKYRKNRKVDFDYQVVKGNVKVTIHSNCILSEEECRKIGEAVDETMKMEMNLELYGEYMARKIVNTLQPKIWACKVDSQDGKYWKVDVSTNSREFTD